MLARRTAHLARCFGAVALSLGVPGLWVACSQTGEDAVDGGIPDAESPARDAATLIDAASRATDASSFIYDATAPRDAALDAADSADATQPISCWSTVVALEAGPDAAPDAEEICILTIPCGLANSTIALTAVGCQVLPGLPDGGVNEAAVATFNFCELLPGQGCEDGGYAMPADGGPAVFTCVGCPTGGGRRPSGFRRRVARGASAVGAFVAQLAQLEAVSVFAFDGLAKELEMHLAPRGLIASARASARDEVRHARAMGQLARRFGGAVPAVQGGPAGRRTLLAIARENAVEGCVRETYGALVNAWQAVHAGDARVRATMQRIARDELRHAALSWEIQAWAEPLLSSRERRAVGRARRRAVAQVVASSKQSVPSELRDILGLPGEAEAFALARGLSERLWGTP